MGIPVGRYWELLGGYVGPQRWKVVVLGALLLGNVGLQVAKPLVVRRFIDAAVAGSAPAALTGIALLFIGVAALTQLAAVAETYVAKDVGWRTTNALRADLAAHCLGLDMAFHNAHVPGELIERVDGDVAALADFFSRLLLRVLASVLLLAGTLAVLTWIDWRVGVAFAVFAAGGLALLHRIRNVAVPYLQADRETAAALFGYIVERLSGTEDVRSRGATGYVLRGLYQRMRDRLRARRKADAMSVGLLGTMTVLLALGTALAFSVGGALFQAGAITIGTVYLVVNYAWLVARPLGQLSQHLQGFQRAAANVGRVQELLGARSAVRDGRGERLPAGPLSVELEHVSFAYPVGTMGATKGERRRTNGTVGGDSSFVLRPSSNLVLRDVSFSLRPGAVLGVLGRTGSGKTTLTRLLLRLYDPEPLPVHRTGSRGTGSGGAVRLGGVDLRAARLSEVRERVGMVTQEVQLFEAPVRDNLTFFNRAIPDARILDALRALGLGAWYDALPAGLDTELAAHGAGLSAGEAQLLAFARVFLKDPGLVILDEAASRLDPATERLIERAVDVLLGEGGPGQGVERSARTRTAIIVAHRLATVQRADEILILEDGQVREHGGRVELANDPSSRYAGLLRTGLEVAFG